MDLVPRLKARILSYWASRRAGARDVDRPVLYAVYATDIMTRLARIHAHPERDGPNGILVVALQDRAPAYVRCAFTGDATLLCEAVAGAYPPRPDKPAVMEPETEAALRKIGYWRDEATGRFLCPLNLGPEPDSADWGGAAVNILNPLIDVFGARAGSKIAVIAPLAP